MPITPIKCAYLTSVLRKSRSRVSRHSSPLIEYIRLACVKLIAIRYDYRNISMAVEYRGDVET